MAFSSCFSLAVYWNGRFSMPFSAPFNFDLYCTDIVQNIGKYEDEPFALL